MDTHTHAHAEAPRSREIGQFGRRNIWRKPSMRRAINAKCRECIYDPVGGTGTWRAQVEACTSYSCPLYPLRPTSQGGKEN
jgi:hypothetical protein